MSDHENSTDYNFVENEHNIFVQLLAKHKILFGTGKTLQINKRKLAAATTLVNEYNDKCENKLTVRQVFKKVSNMKSRLKEKNYKNLTRRKKLPYTTREQMFLDVWIGSDITVLANKASKPPDDQSQQNATPNDIREKIETDDYEVEDTRSSKIATVISADRLEVDTEPEMRFKDEEEDEDYRYKNMSLDELKRVALIAQIKTLQEKTAAAKAKRHLNMYKLWFLKGKKGSV